MSVPGRLWTSNTIAYTQQKIPFGSPPWHNARVLTRGFLTNSCAPKKLPRISKSAENAEKVDIGWQYLTSQVTQQVNAWKKNKMQPFWSLPSQLRLGNSLAMDAFLGCWSWPVFEMVYSGNIPRIFMYHTSLMSDIGSHTNSDGEKQIRLWWMSMSWSSMPLFFTEAAIFPSQSWWIVDFFSMNEICKLQETWRTRLLRLRKRLVSYMCLGERQTSEDVSHEEIWVTHLGSTHEGTRVLMKGYNPKEINKLRNHSFLLWSSQKRIVNWECCGQERRRVQNRNGGHDLTWVIVPNWGRHQKI